MNNQLLITIKYSILIFSLVFLFLGGGYFIDIAEPKELYIKTFLGIGLLGSIFSAIYLTEVDFQLNKIFLKFIYIAFILIASFFLMIFSQDNIPPMLCMLKSCTQRDDFGMIFVYFSCLPLTVVVYLFMQKIFRDNIMVTIFSSLTGSVSMLIYLVLTICL